MFRRIQHGNKGRSAPFREELKKLLDKSFPETWDECLKRHGGNEKEAKAIWEQYEKEIETDYQYDARFTFTLDMIEMQDAGYPFDKDDLTYAQWKWIFELRNAIKEYYLKK